MSTRRNYYDLERAIIQKSKDKYNSDPTIISQCQKKYHHTGIDKISVLQLVFTNLKDKYDIEIIDPTIHDSFSTISSFIEEHTLDNQFSYKGNRFFNQYYIGKAGSEDEFVIRLTIDVNENDVHSYIEIYTSSDNQCRLIDSVFQYQFNYQKLLLSGKIIPSKDIQRPKELIEKDVDAITQALTSTSTDLGVLYSLYNRKHGLGNFERRDLPYHVSQINDIVSIVNQYTYPIVVNTILDNYLIIDDYYQTGVIRHMVIITNHQLIVYTTHHELIEQLMNYFKG